MTSSARCCEDAKVRQAKRLRGLQVHYKFDFVGCLDRQIGRLFALANPSGVNADLAKRGRRLGPKLIRPPAATNSRRPIERRKRTASRQRDERSRGR